jgi:hypothetical protein
LQFHCGIPPPAAEPRTRAFIYHYFMGKLRTTCTTSTTTSATVQKYRGSPELHLFSGTLSHEHPWAVPASQRVQMYIVTSKPNLSSTNVGLLQAIFFS